MTDSEKVALLIKVFSSTGPFPHSSGMPKPVMSSTHRGTCLEDLTEEPIVNYLNTLKDERAKGRFVARWHWWRYRDTMARTHFGREVFGAQPRDYADERREPEYYAALWPELAELVNAHWQELTPSAIGLPNDYLSMPSKDIERFVDHVEGFFAKKQREAEEKRDELNAVGKAAAREALALLAATPENQTAETQSSSPEFAMLGRLSGVKGTPTADDKLIKAYIAQRDGVPDGTPKIEVLRAISRNELTTVACDPNKRVWLSRKAALTVNKAKVGGHDPDKNMINKHARTLERRLNRALADMRPAQACK